MMSKMLPCFHILFACSLIESNPGPHLVIHACNIYRRLWQRQSTELVGIMSISCIGIGVWASLLVYFWRRIPDFGAPVMDLYLMQLTLLSIYSVGKSAGSTTDEYWNSAYGA